MIRTLVLIDGANLWATTKELGYKVNFKKLHEYLSIRHKYILRMNYYSALREVEDGHIPMKGLMDWLEYNGFFMRLKTCKTFINQTTGVVRDKGNMDVELAVDAMLMAEHVQEVVLFSGDGDFRCLVEALQMKGIRVIVYSSIRTSPPMIADELRRQADRFIDLGSSEIISAIQDDR